MLIRCSGRLFRLQRIYATDRRRFSLSTGAHTTIHLIASRSESRFSRVSQGYRQPWLVKLTALDDDDETAHGPRYICERETRGTPRRYFALLVVPHRSCMRVSPLIAPHRCSIMALLLARPIHAVCFPVKIKIIDTLVWSTGLSPRANKFLALLAGFRTCCLPAGSCPCISCLF